MAYSTGSSPAGAVGQQQQHLTKLNVAELSPTNTAVGNLMASSLSPTDDIIKMGILRKGKKAKKRFFVLHQETYGKSARLDCYESDKQYYKHRAGNGGAQPKLSLPMKTCFNINKRIDNKLKHCVAVYTMDDVLLVGCESEQEQEAWLQTLLTVLRNTKGGFGQDDSGRLNYDHVWDVNILRDRGLTEKNPSLSGQYRLCMTHVAIFLYRKGEDVHSLEFPLVFIASYGCKGTCWFLRVGRTAMTGSGELTMETEDPIIAANINETMKSILDENHDQRQRSTSIGDRRQGSAWSGRSGSTVGQPMSSQSSAAASSTSLERSGSLVNPQSRSRAISESEKTLQSILVKTSTVVAGGAGSGYKTTRKISAPASGDRFCAETGTFGGQFPIGFTTYASPKKQSRQTSSPSGTLSLRGHLSHARGSGAHTVNTPDVSGSMMNAALVSQASNLSTASSCAVSPGSTSSITGSIFANRSSAYSPTSAHTSQWMPPGQSPLASNAFCSTDSLGSGSITSEHDHGIGRYLPRQNFSNRASSMEVVGAAIAEESSGSGAEYLPMQASSATKTRGDDDGSKSTISSRTSSTNTVLLQQQRSSNVSQQQPSDKSSARGETYVDMGPSPSAAATGDRRRMTADSGYLEMARAHNTANQLPSSSSSDHVAGLAGYTPMGPGSVGRSSSSAHSRQTSWHLEEVRSYISDSDNSSCSVPPSRAWSLGSRPNASGDAGGNGSSYMAMGPTMTTAATISTTAPLASPMAKFGLFLSSRLGGGTSSADDRKRAHSVGSWNKPLWKKTIAVSNMGQPDAMMTPSSSIDPSVPSTSSSFYRPRSESFGSARSTPGSRRLTETGSKLSNQSEDLVEMEFGRSSMGRSPSGSLGSSESISRSRASSVGNGGTGGGNGSSGLGGGSTLFGRQPWSPRVEQITEQDVNVANSPSGKLIQMFQQQMASGGPTGILSEEYVPMGASGDGDYCSMMLGMDSNKPMSHQPDDYVAMAIEPKQGARSSVTRQHSNPGNNDPTIPDRTNTAVKVPQRHGSGSSNLSLGNSNCMGLDSGVGGSSFSLDQQKPDAPVISQQQLAPNIVTPVISTPTESRGSLSKILSPMDQLKERLARVERTGVDSRKSTNEESDPYMHMVIPAPKQKSSASVDSKSVRRSSSFAKPDQSHRTNPTTNVNQNTKPSQPISSQSPSTSRSPLFKMFASFGKGSSKQQTTATPCVEHKSPTPSLKSVPSGSDSRSRTPSASSKISLTETTSTKLQQRTPVIVTVASVPPETQQEGSTQLEYASLDLQQPDTTASPMTRKTPSPRPTSSCSTGANEIISKLPTQTPAVMVNDGVVYASIDPTRTSATAVDAKVILSSRQL